MSIKIQKLLYKELLVQQVCIHTEQMLEYGTKIVGGVTPGKGGTDSSRSTCI